MNKRMHFLITFLVLTGFYPGATQAQFYEKIDRCVVALTVDGTHACIGWRLLQTHPADIGFNVYRKEVGLTEFKKVNKDPISNSTNFVDASVKPGMAYRYWIIRVIKGIEAQAQGEATLFMLSGNQPYYSVKLKVNSRLKRFGIGLFLPATARPLKQEEPDQRSGSSTNLVINQCSISGYYNRY